MTYRPIRTCSTCKRPLVLVWSGYARCECGTLTVADRLPWNLGNKRAPGSQENPWKE